MAGPLHEPHHHPGPLLEPAHVQGDLRGDVGRAVQVAEGAKIRRFAGRAGGHALVEPGHPGFDPAEGDLGQAGPAQRGQLQVGLPGSSGYSERLLGMFERGRRVDGPLRLDQGHPPPLDRVGVAVQQVPGPGQPAIRQRVIPQALGVLAGEEDGHMRRGFVQASSTVGGIGALPGLDRTGDIGQPPPGPGQTVKDLRRLLVGQLGLEGSSSCLPLGHAQRVPSGLWSRRAGHGPDHRIACSGPPWSIRGCVSRLTRQAWIGRIGHRHPARPKTATAPALGCRNHSPWLAASGRGLAGVEQGGADPGVAAADLQQPHGPVRRWRGRARPVAAGRGCRCRRGCGGPPRPAGRPGPPAPSPHSACPDRSGRHRHSPW